jgi:hypothetical protein
MPNVVGESEYPERWTKFLAALTVENLTRHLSSKGGRGGGVDVHKILQPNSAAADRPTVRRGNCGRVSGTAGAAVVEPPVLERERFV